MAILGHGLPTASHVQNPCWYKSVLYAGSPFLQNDLSFSSSELQITTLPTLLLTAFHVIPKS